MSDRSERVHDLKAWQSVIDQWLGRRKFVISGDASVLCNAFWTSMVMSHQHRYPEQSGQWRSAVDRSLRRCRAAHSVLLASSETPLGSYLIQAARRVQVPVLQLRLPLPDESLDQWEERVPIAVPSSEPSAAPWSPESRFAQLWLSPIIEPATTSVAALDHSRFEDGRSSTFEQLPIIDRALVAIADCIHVISLRSKSKTEWLIMERLADHRFPTGTVFVVMHSPSAIGPRTSKTSPGTSKSHRSRFAQTLPRRLLDLGAVGWIQARPVAELARHSREFVEVPEPTRPLSAQDDNPDTIVPCFAYSIKERDWARNWPYLSHCTRARSGAWPDQSQIGYYDSLLAMKDDVDLDASAFNTLKRILLQKRLIASNELKRSALPTVSFTQVPLHDLLPRRQFQAHLGRWDWEPYGLCIDRKWIEQNGGQRVLYRPSSQWNELTSDEQPYFQPSSTPNTLDQAKWELEEEWRVVGDIHLVDIPFQSAFVFVSTSRQAAELAAISRFPIVIISPPYGA